MPPGPGSVDNCFNEDMDVITGEGKRKMENQQADNGKAIAKTNKAGSSTAIAKPSEAASPFAAFGFNEAQVGALRVQTLVTGGVSKWVDLKGWLKDPGAITAKREDVLPGAIAGFLVGRHEIEAENGTELNEAGEKVRFYYAVELVVPCAVAYKSGDAPVRELAKPGEIVNIGERFQLQVLRPYADMVLNGAKVAVIITPWDKLSIGGGKTMWTFKVETAEARAPRAFVGTIASPPAGSPGAPF